VEIGKWSLKAGDADVRLPGSLAQGLGGADAVTITAVQHSGADFLDLGSGAASTEAVAGSPLEIRIEAGDNPVEVC
jgi:hypothetical protein